MFVYFTRPLGSSWIFYFFFVSRVTNVFLSNEYNLKSFFFVLSLLLCLFEGFVDERFEGC